MHSRDICRHVYIRLKIFSNISILSSSELFIILAFTPSSPKTFRVLVRSTTLRTFSNNICDMISFISPIFTESLFQLSPKIKLMYVFTYLIFQYHRLGLFMDSCHFLWYLVQIKVIMFLLQCFD